jgi:ABC-type multidrug transport system fused ATPase/permease subunit
MSELQPKYTKYSAREFIEKVCGEIKSKKAKTSLENEIFAHIEDSKAHYISEGFDEYTAEEKAVEQMGSPYEVGQSLNQIHRDEFDWLSLILNIVMWILAVGVFVLHVLLGIALAFGGGLVLFGIGLIIGGGVISLCIVTLFKIFIDTAFNHSLMKDFQRRNKLRNRRVK